MATYNVLLKCELYRKVYTYLVEARSREQAIRYALEQSAPGPLEVVAVQRIKFRSKKWR